MLVLILMVVLIVIGGWLDSRIDWSSGNSN